MNQICDNITKKICAQLGMKSRFYLQHKDSNPMCWYFI